MEAQPAVDQLQQVADRDQTTDAAITPAAEPVANDAVVMGLPTANSHDTTMHNTDKVLRGEAAERSSRQPGKQQSVDAGLTAALGGLLALSGSVLSYALARARSGKRVRHLKAGLQEKETALEVTQAELQQAQQQVATLKAAAARRTSLEAELAASRSNLEAMTAELEAARAASTKIESDFATIQDQLHCLASSQQQISAARAAAEQRVTEADQARREAEQRWKKAFEDLDGAQKELETVKGELGLTGSQLEALTRELEFTRRELAAAQKRVERAMTETRSARSGYSGAEYDAWEYQ